MLKQLTKILGFAALFVVGNPATGYSDSLPAIVGHTLSLNDASCISPSSTNVTNICNHPITFEIPIQSRVAGTLAFYGAKPKQAQDLNTTTCRAIADDQTNNFQNQTNAIPVNGSSFLGNLSVAANTVLHFECTLNPQAQLSSVNFNQ